MRKRKLFSATIFAVLFQTMISGLVLADSTTQGIVDDFTAMNNGKGYLFQSMTYTAGSNAFFHGIHGTGENRLVNRGTDIPDLSAYTSKTSGYDSLAGGSYFQTFCVNAYQSFYPGENTSGKLNFNSTNGTTSTFVPQINLKMGVAYLYKEFAAGNLAGYNYNYGTNRIDSAVEIQDAIWFLMGFDSEMKVTNAATAWTSNTFLMMLNGMTGYDQAFWMADYDPAGDYSDLMGDAKVFIMRNNFDSNIMTRSPNGNVRQDVLYVTLDGESSGDPSGAPEPASLLLWMLGSLGAAGAAYRKRRMNCR